MNKMILLLFMFLLQMETHSQNSSQVEQTPDEILLNNQSKYSQEELKSKEELDAIISKAEQQKAVDEIMKGTETPQKDAWGDALREQEGKQKTEEYSVISQADLYEDLPDGTRRAKYPYIPAGAKTIADVEKYFKEHPSEMVSNEIDGRKLNDDSPSTYSSNLFENGVGVYVIIIALIICFTIAEIFGRSKHIGRWWSFLLLLCGFIPGIIALINSPSAKGKPTNGGRSHYIWACIFLVFGVLNAIALIASKGQSGHMTFVFLTFSIYLFELKKGLIINKNPKYYI